jgi:hypothetical protein
LDSILIKLLTLCEKRNPELPEYESSKEKSNEMKETQTPQTRHMRPHTPKCIHAEEHLNTYPLHLHLVFFVVRCQDGQEKKSSNAASIKVQVHPLGSK